MNPSDRWAELSRKLGTSDLQTGLATTGQPFAGAHLQLDEAWTLRGGNMWKERLLSIILAS